MISAATDRFIRIDEVISVTGREGTLSIDGCAKAHFHGRFDWVPIPLHGFSRPSRNG